MLEIYSDLVAKYGQDNMWVKWFKSKLTKVNDLEYPSIREYQTTFGRKRPIWARSFRERGIKKEIDNNPDYYLGRVVQYKSAWRIEREITRSDESTFVVERTFDMSYERICRAVTIVRFDYNSQVVIVTKNLREGASWNDQTFTIHNFNKVKLDINNLFTHTKPWDENMFK